MQAKLGTHFKTFLELTELPQQDFDNLEKLAQSWNYSTYPNMLKDFLYKFIYNRLLINTRLYHIVTDETVSRECTFCVASKSLPAPEETFKHLFWYCPITAHLRNKFFETLAPELQHLPEQQKKLFWYTGIYEHEYPPLINIARSVFLLAIWEMHQKRKFSHGQHLKSTTFMSFLKLKRTLHLPDPESETVTFTSQDAGTK